MSAWPEWTLSSARKQGGRLASASPIVVTGMHRSGLSLIASLLEAMVADLPGKLEDADLAAGQRRLLAACDRPEDGVHPDWQRTERERLDRHRFQAEADALAVRHANEDTRWGWTDARTTPLLELWHGQLKNAVYILVYRVPWEVSDSLQRQGEDTFLRNPEHAYHLWESYNRLLRDFYVAHADRCVMVCANALPAGIEAFAHAVRMKLGLPARDADLRAIYDPTLLNTTASDHPLVDLSTAIWPRCAQLLSELDGLADVPAAGRWHGKPFQSRLLRPDSQAGPGDVDLSVVIPCYNQGALLVEAVASVEAFAPARCELAIINDGSTDARTLEILDTLRALGYFVLDQANKGLAATRNAGIRQTRGRYILPLDDDNRIRARFIQDALAVLDSCPSIGVVYGNRCDFGLLSGECAVPDFDLYRMLCGNYIDACAVIRRQLWLDCQGYDESMRALEDYELWIHAASRGWHFHHLPYVTFDYRTRPDSLIRRTLDTPGAHEECGDKIRRKHANVYWWTSLTQIETLTARLAEHAAREREHTAEIDRLRAEVAGLTNAAPRKPDDAV